MRGPEAGRVAAVRSVATCANRLQKSIILYSIWRRDTKSNLLPAATTVRQELELTFWTMILEEESLRGCKQEVSRHAPRHKDVDERHACAVAYTGKGGCCGLSVIFV